MSVNETREELLQKMKDKVGFKISRRDQIQRATNYLAGTKEKVLHTRVTAVAL